MPVKSRWNERDASGLDGRPLCAYASRLIGADPRLVLWGGGNSSIKTREKSGPVVWVKASGHDMRSIGPEGFTGLRLDGLLAHRSRASMSDAEMVAALAQDQLDPAAAKPSIETLLHAWLDAPHVYHTHADDVAAFTCTPRSEERVRTAFGDGVLWVPYLRPGFELSKLVSEAVRRAPNAWALVLDKHGALTWGNTAREAYEAMIRLVREAGRDVKIPGDAPEWTSDAAASPLGETEARAKGEALARSLRAVLDPDGRAEVRWSRDPEVLDFLRRPEAETLSQRGPFTMEHSLRTKAKPLFWRLGSDASLREAVEGYRRWYRGYFDAYAPKGTPEMDPNPRVVLVPELGLFATGRDAREAEAAEDVYRHTVQVISRVASFTRYTPLSGAELAGVEFWELETRKLKRLQAVST